MSPNVWFWIRRISYGFSPGKTPGKKMPESKPGNITKVVGMIPWMALISCSFSLIGLVIFLIHGKKAGTQSSDLLTSVNSQGHGFADRIRLFHESYSVTAGITGGCILSSSVMAVLRMQQKLRGNKKKKMASSRACARVAVLVGAGSIVFLSGAIAWFTLNGAYLSSWALGLSSLNKAISASSLTMQKFGSEIAADPKFSEPVKVDKDTATCPSAACFDMRYFPWLDSASCLCNQQLLSSTKELVDSLFDSVVWTLAAMGCLHFGALLGLLQSIAAIILSHVLLKTKNSENSKAMVFPSPSKGPTNLDLQKEISYALTPGTALKKPNIQQLKNGGGGYVSPYPGWGGGYMD